MLEVIAQYRNNIDLYKPKIIAKGRLVRVSGLILEASGCKTELGGICSIKGDLEDTEAEVIGFEGDRIFMMSVGSMSRLKPGAEVIPLDDKKIGVGANYLGRVIDGNGKPLDSKGEIIDSQTVSLFNKAINPLHRLPIREILDTGIGAINSLITVGRGQRLGLFAGSGVGKSVLMGMMTKHTDADVIIVGLIGERGREVKEFIEDILDEKSLSRAVVIAAPADESPTMKIRGANLATRFAEYFRDQGRHVLLLMDSLTRFAQAQRQISLAVGEPPSTKGYPPSVFAKLPELVERAGNGTAGGGSITAFYTVLTEGDDMQDPVADSARAVLDGHVVLSRQLAESGHFPAIDIEASISRTMPNIVTPEHRMLATKFRQHYSLYRRNEDLISVGAYAPGNDVELDSAVEKFPHLKSFLKQDITEQLRLKPCLDKMGKIV